MAGIYYDSSGIINVAGLVTLVFLGARLATFLAILVIERLHQSPPIAEVRVQQQTEYVDWSATNLYAVAVVAQTGAGNDHLEIEVVKAHSPEEAQGMALLKVNTRFPQCVIRMYDYRLIQ